MMNAGNLHVPTRLGCLVDKLYRYYYDRMQPYRSNALRLLLSVLVFAPLIVVGQIWDGNCRKFHSRS